MGSPIQSQLAVHRNIAEYPQPRDVIISFSINRVMADSTDKYKEWSKKKSRTDVIVDILRI